MSLKDWLRKKTPLFVLSWNRQLKKRRSNKKLSTQADKGQSFTKELLMKDLIAAGLEKGDSVLVHSSLSKIGHLIDGPKTVVDALIEVVGDHGHILMPTSPNSSLQLDYVQSIEAFNVSNSKSKTGAITEYFRQIPETKRSLHPTEPVSVLGKNANYFIDNHFQALTPYQKDSPFMRVAEMQGKILYIGVTLDNAGTSLHTLEDAVSDFKYPVYHPSIFDVLVIDEAGEKHLVKTKVHNPKFSVLRKCDQLIPHFKAAGVMEEFNIGKAKTLVVDAQGFFDTMIRLYHEKGITMYSPNGENITIN